MFNPTEKTFIDPKRYQLVHLYQSLNQPQISPGTGMSAETSIAYTMIARVESHQLQIFIGLFFPESDQRVMYETPAFPPEFIEDRLSVAEAFLSQMGFLMDNTHYHALALEEKKEMLRTVPFVYSTMELYYKALRPGELEAKKSKVEGIKSREVEVDHQKLFLEQYLAIVSML